MIPILAWSLVLILQLEDGRTLRAAVDGARNLRECREAGAEVARSDLRWRCSTKVDPKMLRVP